MTQQWPPLPPGTPPPRRRRFAGWFILLGTVAAVIGLAGAAALGGFATSSPRLAQSGLGVLVFFGSLLAPLVVGIVLASIGALSPAARGFGLGLVIGWAAALIIAGGACVALIVALSSSGTSA